MLRIKGFTILETLISLIIMCSLLMIGSLKLKNYQSTLILRNSVRVVTMAIEQASRVSTINREPIKIIFFSESNILMVSGRHYMKRIAINKEIKIANLSDFNISSKGMIKPRTIVFSNDNEIEKVRIQMTWGRIIYD